MGGVVLGGQVNPYELKNLAGSDEAQLLLQEMRAELVRLLEETE